MPKGHVQLIDHGISFHEEYKLRTVIWDFAGRTIPAALVTDLQKLSSKLEGQGSLSLDLAGLLSSLEIQALRDRHALLLREARFPVPGTERNHPWPLI
jgi:uncharacterized repeat protein (TIGR03843 family)